MDKQPLKTPCGELSWIEPQHILYVKYTQNANPSLDDMKRHIELTYEHFNPKKEPQLMISDIRHVNFKPRKDVRDYLKSKEVYQGTRALAILVNNGFSRLVGNIFLSFDRPPHPIKIFSNQEKAMQWLEFYK